MKTSKLLNEEIVDSNRLATCKHWL